jgi:hypothetical protein
MRKHCGTCIKWMKKYDCKREADGQKPSSNMVPCDEYDKDVKLEQALLSRGPNEWD